MQPLKDQGDLPPCITVHAGRWERWFSAGGGGAGLQRLLFRLDSLQEHEACLGLRCSSYHGCPIPAWRAGSAEQVSAACGEELLLW